MIMAGRGKRLDVGDKPKSVDDATPNSVNEGADSSTLKEKIKQLNLTDMNFPTLMGIRNLFNQLCCSKETLKDLLRDLHGKALSEADFGEKLVIILEPMTDFEVNGVLLRNELLTLIQNDFEVKDTMCKSDPEKFVNAVTLLGGVYNRIKVCGAPIAVLGLALLDYFDLLLEGGEEELKALTKQILLNGNTLSEAPTFDHFKIKLREILINSTSDSVTKCWILLLIDLISNDLKPLKGPINEFYISKLKDGYTKLELLKPAVTKEIKHSPQKISGETTSPRNQEMKSELQNASSIKKDSSKFSDLTVKSEGYNHNFKSRKDKGQISPGKNAKKDNWKQNMGKESSMSEHDDRFIKEENYYGVQTPRQPKFESKKHNRMKKKDSDQLGTDQYNIQAKDVSVTLDEEEYWD